MKLTKKNPTKEVKMPTDKTIPFKRIVSFNYQTGERKITIETNDKTIQKQLKDDDFLD